MCGHQFSPRAADFSDARRQRTNTVARPGARHRVLFDSHRIDAAVEQSAADSSTNVKS
ncbi:hypothetical protein [Streptomyces sp. NPDC012510]|uniref:hypothetical protein n=1 Tax=Streptomyces sp. NPDC012510 TaxID=3364838 RepID=UPI0036E4D127